MNLDKPLNTVMGVQVPREQRYKRLTDPKSLFTQPADIPFSFYDAANCIGRNAYDDSCQNHVPSIKNFLDYLYECKPIGFKEFEKDHIWTYIDVAFDFGEIVDEYLRSVKGTVKKPV